jgi:hypothetical protein
MGLRAFVTVMAIGAAMGCSYNKQCFGDGVCKITKNGVTTYEGPPDKVAEYEAKEQGDKKKAAELDKAYAEAPKRDAAEPIRIVVIANSAASGLVPLMPEYAAMLEQALAGNARLQMVPVSKVKLYLQAQADGEKQPVGATAKVTPALAEQSSSQVGKSTAGISVAGIDKQGKAQSGELKAKRSSEADRPALQALATWMGEATTKMQLPSLAAAKEIRSKHGQDLLKGLTNASR